jgi:hypothetical protein
MNERVQEFYKLLEEKAQLAVFFTLLRYRLLVTLYNIEEAIIRHGSEKA